MPSAHPTLVSHPEIFIIGGSALDTDEVVDFATYHGLADALDDHESPLWRAVEHAPPVDAAPFVVEFASRTHHRDWASSYDRTVYIGNLIRAQRDELLDHATLHMVISGVSRGLLHDLRLPQGYPTLTEQNPRDASTDGIRFVVPPALLHFCDLTDVTRDVEQAQGAVREIMASFEQTCQRALNEYLRWYKFYRNALGCRAHVEAQYAARGFLPACAETTAVWSPTLRQVREFCLTYGTREDDVDLEARRFACFLYEVCSSRVPEFFSDMLTAHGSYSVPVIVQA